MRPNPLVLIFVTRTCIDTYSRSEYVMQVCPNGVYFPSHVAISLCIYTD